MKIIICTLLCILSVNTYALDSKMQLDRMLEQVRDSSAGRLIKINSEGGNSVAITFANGSVQGFYDVGNIISVANKICDFKLPWSATENSIFCIVR